jgi:hypothetical protein
MFEMPSIRKSIKPLAAQNMQKKKHSAETCNVADWPNFRLFQQKNVRNLEKNTFFKIILKYDIFRLYVYIFEHSIHFRKFCFVKLI